MLTIDASMKSRNATAHSRASASLPRRVARNDGVLVPGRWPEQPADRRPASRPDLVWSDLDRVAGDRGVSAGLWVALSSVSHCESPQPVIGSH